MVAEKSDKMEINNAPEAAQIAYSKTSFFLLIILDFPYFFAKILARTFHPRRESTPVGDGGDRCESDR